MLTILNEVKKNSFFMEIYTVIGSYSEKSITKTRNIIIKIKYLRDIYMSVNKIINESFACFGKSQTMNENRGLQSDLEHHEDDIKDLYYS